MKQKYVFSSVIRTVSLCVSLLIPATASQLISAEERAAHGTQDQYQVPQYPVPQYPVPQYSVPSSPEYNNNGMMPGEMPPLPPDIKPEDFEKMVNSIEEELKKLSPEELAQLEKEAREVLTNEGIDPDTFQPIPGSPAAAQFAAAQNSQAAYQPFTPPAAPEEPKTIEKPKKEETTAHRESDCASILRTIIRNGGSLQKKIADHATLAKNFTAIQKSLPDVVTYAKAIDKSEHHKRLASKEWESLFCALQTAAHALEKYEPQCTQTAAHIVTTDNPYDLLRVSSDAADAQITKAFEKLRDEHDSEKLRKKLAAEGLAKEDIERQVKSARSSFETIQEAYDKISDTKTRAQTDRSLKSSVEQQQALDKTAQKACDELSSALLCCFDSQKLLKKLEDFVQKFEPSQLIAKAETPQKKSPCASTCKQTMVCDQTTVCNQAKACDQTATCNQAAACDQAKTCETKTAGKTDACKQK